MREGGHLPDDEALSAFLDGALAAEDAALLRRRLGAEPALARRLAELRHVDETLRGAYAGVADEEAPRRILELVRGKDVPARHRSGRSVRVVRLALPLTAIAGLAAGCLVAILVLRHGAMPSPPGLVAASGVVEQRSALHQVLETVPSGETRDVGNAWTATPRLTFVSGEGRPCRRVDLNGAGGTVEAIACRREAQWHTELIGYVPARKTGGNDVYQPASGEPPSRIDDAMSAMMQGSPFGRDEERAWILRGWSGTDAPGK